MALLVGQGKHGGGIDSRSVWKDVSTCVDYGRGKVEKMLIKRVMQQSVILSVQGQKPPLVLFKQLLSPWELNRGFTETSG